MSKIFQASSRVLSPVAVRGQILSARCHSRRALSLCTLPSCSSSFTNRPILVNHRVNFQQQSLRFCSSNDKKSPEQVEVAEKEDALEVIDNTESMTTVKIPDVFPNVPLIAINRYPLFPGFIKKVDLVKSESLKNLIRKRLEMKQPYVGVFVKKDDENKAEAITSLSDIYNVGSFAHILEMRDVGQIIELVLSAHRRIRIVEALDEETTTKVEKYKTLNGRRAGRRKYDNQLNVPSEGMEGGYAEKLFAEDHDQLDKKQKEPKDKEEKEGKKRIVLVKTENVIAEPIVRDNQTKATMQAIVQTIRDIVAYSPLFGQQIQLLLHPSQNVIENPVYLCDLVASLVQSADTKELQQVMESKNINQRLNLALELVEKEKTVAKLKHDINKDVEKKVQEHHRKYLLHEQLKVIKKELGIEKDEKVTIIDKMEEKMKNLKIPEYAMKVIKEEQQKLQYLEPTSSEFNVTRNYLDWLTNMPWGLVSEENTDLKKAKEALDEGHYGMKDVKQRILEFIAINILKKSVGGKILCFHGPPGVGKTSIAKSIAAALNRQYFRFSVGGMTDVSEIKGHRRTYVGAMPGKMIQCLKKVQTENPLVLIDEIDKIGGAGFHGDPASALLELLDPEQNANFNDHFLDVPIDLTKVLFICTANEVDRIPGALRDRMELIDVSGYLAEEKMQIARKYLIPQARKETSLTEEQLTISEDVLDELIKHYCRESGVRNLQKHIERIFRKAALQIAEVDQSSVASVISVTNENLTKYVGKPKFTSDRMYDITPPGVVMGLAWTAMGGSALYIETVLKRAVDESSDKDGSLETTGNLGDVMKESVRTALTVAKGISSREKPDSKFFEKAHIHIHVPEGATPKDGPSAGVTLVSSLLSLALNKPVRQRMAMTGEISLTGKVLPVGGIREKVIAARRVGATLVFLPSENRRDYDELPDFMRDDIEVRFVTHYDELYKELFE